MEISLSMFIQSLVGGIFQGSIYALVALGLTIVFGVMRVLNLAHGTFVMLGAYMTFWAYTLFKIDPLLSIILVSMPALFILGLAIQRWLISRLFVIAPEDFELMSAIFCFGLSSLFINLAIYFWTADFRSVRYITDALTIGGISFSKVRIISFVVAIAITSAVALFLKKANLGIAIRATSQNRNSAEICGIPTKRIFLFVFGLGCALAAAGGSLLSIQYAIYPQIGDDYTTKSFCIIILGGMGSYLGAFAGGLILGLAEALSSLFIGAKFSEAVAFLALILILLFKPTGLFGKEGS
ncbi:MAG: branched-chain amino acid ABC transporter permease [Deltaproteobacteria bacterium]|nr:branched-chain amino acid ABC transporter permease [Deltaproteobacteria bacterium]